MAASPQLHEQFKYERTGWTTPRDDEYEREEQTCAKMVEDTMVQRHGERCQETSAVLFK